MVCARIGECHGAAGKGDIGPGSEEWLVFEEPGADSFAAVQCRAGPKRPTMLVAGWVPEPGVVRQVRLNGVILDPTPLWCIDDQLFPLVAGRLGAPRTLRERPGSTFRRLNGAEPTELAIEVVGPHVVFPGDSPDVRFVVVPKGNGSRLFAPEVLSRPCRYGRPACS